MSTLFKLPLALSSFHSMFISFSSSTFGLLSFLSICHLFSPQTQLVSFRQASPFHPICFSICTSHIFSPPVSCICFLCGWFHWHLPAPLPPPTSFISFVHLLPLPPSSTSFFHRAPSHYYSSTQNDPKSIFGCQYAIYPMSMPMPM